MNNSVITSTGVDYDTSAGDSIGFPDVDIDLGKIEEVVIGMQSTKQAQLSHDRALGIFGQSTDIDFNSLYGQLRQGDSLRVTPSLTIRTGDTNIVVLTVLRGEGESANTKNIKLADLQKGIVYYIDRDSIASNGAITVLNTATNRPFTYNKIHSVHRLK